MTAIVIFLMLGSITIIIWQGAIDVAAGRISGGTIAAFVLYSGLLAGAFGGTSEVYGDLLRAAGGVERLTELLEAGGIRAPENPVKLPEPPRGNSSSTASPFTIPRAAGFLSALNDFNLVVEAARAARRLGPSGAGKTTSSSSPSASMIRNQGALCSTGSTFAELTLPTSAIASRWPAGDGHVCGLGARQSALRGWRPKAWW